jgi:Mg2+ and Co2+ transporter CorA
MAAMTKNRNFLKWPNLTCISIMMSFLTNITAFFMNFELLPILTDYAN